MKLLLQIGYRKISTRSREGQLVQAWVNDVECSWSSSLAGLGAPGQARTGKYITSKVDAEKGVLWYLWKGEVGSEDTVRLSVKTFLAKVGVDEKRTFDALYAVREGAPVREVSVPGVGHRDYPLVKGRIVEIASVSEQDKRIAELNDFVEEEDF